MFLPPGREIYASVLLSIANNWMIVGYFEYLKYIIFSHLAWINEMFTASSELFFFFFFICLLSFGWLVPCFKFCVVWIRLACPCLPTWLPIQGPSTCLCPNRFLACPAVLRHSIHNSSLSSSILRPERRQAHSMMASTLRVSQNQVVPKYFPIYQY